MPTQTALHEWSLKGISSKLVGLKLTEISDHLSQSPLIDKGKGPRRGSDLLEVTEQNRHRQESRHLKGSLDAHTSGPHEQGAISHLCSPGTPLWLWGHRSGLGPSYMANGISLPVSQDTNHPPSCQTRSNLGCPKSSQMTSAFFGAQEVRSRSRTLQAGQCSGTKL